MIELEKLKHPLPIEAISQHPTKTYLSSIKAIYVTERFNEVFGTGKWTVKVDTEHVNHETGMVVVKTTFEVPELKIYYESFGGNDNGSTQNINFDLGDAYKGATTDALTKIGSYLGVGIDVFKGKSGVKAPAIPQKKYDNTPPTRWIGDKDFDSMKTKWVAGNDPKEIIKKIRDANLGVSREMATKITNYVNSL